MTATYEASNKAMLENYWRKVGDALELGIKVYENGDMLSSGELADAIHEARARRRHAVDYLSADGSVMYCTCGYSENVKGLLIPTRTVRDTLSDHVNSMKRAPWTGKAYCFPVVADYGKAIELDWAARGI